MSELDLVTELHHLNHTLRSLDRTLDSLRMDEINARLGRIESRLLLISKEEEKIMAIGDNILAKVTEEDTLLDSCLALLQGLVDAGTIPQATLDAITAKIQGSEDKINAAIAKNTPPPTP